MEDPPLRAGPLESNPASGEPFEDASGPVSGPQRDRAARARFDPGLFGRDSAGRPVADALRIRERLEDFRRRSLDEDRQPKVRGGHRGVIGADAVPASFRNRLEVSKAHSPGILNRAAGRLANRDPAMPHGKGRHPVRSILQFVRHPRFGGADGPSKGESAEDLALIDRRVPGAALGRDDARLPSELEAAADLGLDARPAAKPAGQVFDPE